MKRIFLVLAALLLAPAALAQGYRVQPGDVLSISVLEDANLNRELLVRPDGGISMPIAGNIRAAGNTVQAIERIITERLAPGFSITPSVSVALAALADPNADEEDPETIAVYFIGEINDAGLREVRLGASLLQAIADAGGLTPFAADKRIQLRRTDRTGKETIFLFNYRAVENGATISNNLRVIEGDIIVVPERKLFE